jgi:hypothetical protein
MSTERQKQAARHNLEKARQTQSARSHGARIPRTPGISTAQENDLSEKDFAFPTQRKEPLVDARHVRNAVARFDQVEDVSDRERDQAWRRIQRAAERFDVELEEHDWHELVSGGKTPR